MNTLELSIERLIKSEKTTIGNFSIDKKFFSYVLEDTDRGLNFKMPLAEIKKKKQYGITAIPYGRYKVILSYSPKFKKILPEVVGVPGYVGIRIHGGLVGEHTLGCPLLGYKHGIDCLKPGTSGPAMEDFMEVMEKAINIDKKEVYITIR